MAFAVQLVSGFRHHAVVWLATLPALFAIAWLAVVGRWWWRIALAPFDEPESSIAVVIHASPRGDDAWTKP